MIYYEIYMCKFVGWYALRDVKDRDIVASPASTAGAVTGGEIKIV